MNFSSCAGVNDAVAHGVDATDLGNTLPQGCGPFDRVVFQFPQHPDRRKIHKHRELLRGFFASVDAVLACDGKVVVSLLKGQGGTLAEPPRKASDTWAVQDAAAEAYLIMEHVTLCPVLELSAWGYE